MKNKEFDVSVQREYQQQLQRIIFFVDEYSKGNKEYEQELISILASYKSEMESAKKYHIIFSLLIFYLDKSIMLTNNSLRSDDNYKNLIGYCREDIKYYLKVSKILKSYIMKCLNTGNYEHLDILFLLTIKMSYVLNNISDYFSYIKNMESYANTFIEYRVPNDVRSIGALNKEEIEKSLKVLGLKEEKDV